MDAFIRASSLATYPELVTELGGHPDVFLSRFHIDPKLLRKESSVFPIRSLIRVMEYTAKELNCSDFGLRLAEKQGFRLLGPIALIGLNSPNIEESLKTMLHHLDFHSPVVKSILDKETDPLKPRITFDIDIPGEPHRQQIHEAAMGNVYQELRILTDGQFVPEAVLFQHSSSAPASTYRKYFHAPVYFDQATNAVVFKQEILTRQIDKANPQMQELIIEYVRHASDSHPLDIAAQVRFLSKRLMPSASCGLKDIARNLCMHERTLQRKLKDVNLVYEDVLDALRAERAQELLTLSALPLAQIALSLGYKEQASFTKACWRWFGTTPMAIRQSSVQNLAAHTGRTHH